MLPLTHLYDAGISRQQARLFARLVAKSNDIDWIIERSGLINPKLGQVAKIAKKEKEPHSAIKTLSRVALLVTGLATFTFAADDLWNRWKDGELFQPSASHDIDDVEDNSKRNSNKPTEQEGPDQVDHEFGDGIEI